MKVAKKLILLILGTIFIVIGVFGILLPVLPGIIPLIIGLVLVSKSSKRFANYKPLKTLLTELRVGKDMIVKKMPSEVGKFISFL